MKTQQKTKAVKTITNSWTQLHYNTIQQYSTNHYVSNTLVALMYVTIRVIRMSRYVTDLRIIKVFKIIATLAIRLLARTHKRLTT